MFSRSTVLALAAVAVAVSPAYARLKGKDCEVCIKVLETIQKDGLDVTDSSAVETKLRAFCAETKNGKEERFCYYVGGAETSATGMLGMITKPLKNYLPSEKICEKMKKQDSQICELIYDIPIDLKTLNLEKTRVKVLRKILNDQFQDQCKGCLEKADYIKRIRELAKDEL